MKIEMWPLSKLIAYARNARKIPQSAIDKVAASIQEFGFRQPIVVDKKRVIVVGHTRLLAAQKLELKLVPVHVAKELTSAQIKAYRLADNRTNDEASWDEELLALELSELEKECQFDLSLTAFDEKELAELLGGGDANPSADPKSDTAPQLGEDLLYQVIVSCEGESQQAQLLERLEAEGLTCRALIS